MYFASSIKLPIYGMMEKWNIGILYYRNKKSKSAFAFFLNSIIPLFQPSNIPIFEYYHQLPFKVNSSAPRINARACSE
jgi:hypothetical protein